MTSISFHFNGERFFERKYLHCNGENFEKFLNLHYKDELNNNGIFKVVLKEHIYGDNIIPWEDAYNIM